MDLSLCLTNSQHITLPRPATERSPRALFMKRKKFEQTYSGNANRTITPRASARSLRPNFLFNHVITDAPISPDEALKRLKFEMTRNEVSEIKNYPEIYYVGTITNKISGIDEPFDDIYHYYRVVTKDQIIFRYEIHKTIMKDDYGTFVSAFDHKDKREVVIQILISTLEMKVWGEAQVERQNLIENPDLHHIMQSLDHFEFRNHLFFVYEEFGRPVVEYAKTFYFWSSPNRPIDFPPIEIDHVKNIARPIIEGIRYLHSKNIICGNIGSSSIYEKNGNVRLVNYGYDPYRQALRYRSPEVIMGLPVDKSSDMFSFALFLIELINGKPMFNGSTDNEQFAKYIDFLGMVPKDLLRTSTRARELMIPKSGRVRTDRRDMNYRIQSPIHVPGGTHVRLEAIDSRRSDEESFYDLIKKCLDWWPMKRISADEACRHPWFREDEPKTKKKTTNNLPALSHKS
ncbi:hypothetical protein M9Y10_034035 [Tritrichomonas musculus]|uniref:dual-specificity kinase n=1 Tax=Tritrichomonas musculus TaxID=1915356 RepID=A0ABR2KDU0_9EUKA